MTWPVKLITEYIKHGDGITESHISNEIIFHTFYINAEGGGVGEPCIIVNIHTIIIMVYFSMLIDRPAYLVIYLQWINIY